MLLEYPCAMRRKTYYRRGEGGLMYNHAVIVAIVFFVFTNVISAAPTFETSLPQSHSNEIAEYFSEINGCYYNFQRYEEGDRIVTNEPCLNCTCHNRMLMCYLRVCPFTKAIGQDCTIEKKPDQCCPIITCPEVPVKLLTSSTTSSPAPVTSTTEIGFRDNYGCTINNIFYTDGAQVPSDVNKPCELCYCIRNRTACVMQECTLHVEGCSPVFKPGVCCPVKYECDYDKEYTSSIRPQTTGGLLKSTTLSPVGDCFYGNHYFSDGELIKTEKPCEHCYCMRGDIVCAVQDCGEPLRGKDCIPTTPPPNKCCPSSYACANETASIEDITKASDIAGTTFTQPDDTFSSFDTTTSRYKNTPVVLSQEEVYERLGEKKTPTTTLLPEKIFTTLSSLSSKHPSEDIQLDDESVDADEHVPQPGTTNEPLKEHVTEKDANDDKTTTRRIQSETITPGVSLPKASQGVTITPSQYEATTEILTKVGDENTTKEEFTKSPLDESPDNAVSATEITTEKIKYETTKYAEKVDTTKYNERENTSEKLTTKPIVGNQEQVTVTEKLPSADAVTDEKNSDETTTPIFLYSKFPTDFNRPSSEEPQDENSSEPIKFQLTTRQFDKNSVLSKEQETTTASEESLQPNTKIPPSNTELPVEHQTENMNTLSNESTASLLANITKIVNSVQNSQKIPPYQIPMTETTKAPIADDETTTRKEDYPITEKTAEILTTIKNEVGTVVPSVIPGEGSCLVDGITYPNTSIIESYNPCHSKCVCLSSIPTCTLITCAPPPANPNCMPIQMKPESCCPVYICNDNKEQPSGEVPSSHNQIVLDEPEDVNHFPQEDETTTIVGEHDFSTKVADLNKSTPETITEKSKPENDVSVNKLETTTIAISKPENEVEKKPENDAESKPENVVENKPENDAENKPENDAENKPENDAESKPENDAESKPENVAENKPENDAENKPENDAENKPENDAESKPENNAESKPENDAENKPQNDNVENEHENVNTIENKIDSTTISADKSQNGDAGSQNVADHVTETGSTVSSIADETYKPNIVTTNEQTIQDKIDEPITTTDTPTTVKESIVEESSVENNDLPQVTTVKGVDVKIGFPESPVTVADASESSEKPSSYQDDSSSGNEVHNDENSTSGDESYPTTSQEHLSENSATTKPTTSEKYNDISSSENNSPYQDKETTEFEKIITTEDTLVHLTSISTEPKDEAQKYSTEIPSTEPNPTAYVNEKIDINPTTLPEKITEINPTTLYEKINVNPTTLPPKSPYEQNDAASDSNSPNIAQNNFEASQNPEESITTTEVPAADLPSVTTIAAHSSVSDAESDNEQNDITTKSYELFSSTETQTSEPIKHSEFESITTAKDDLSNEISPVETTTAVHILNEKISTDGESSSIPEVTSSVNEYTSEPYSSSFPTTEKGVELDVTEKLSHEQGQLAGSYNPPVTTNESDTVPVETTEPYIVNEPYQTSYPPSYDSETTVHYNSESEKHTGSGLAVTNGPSSNVVTTNSPDDEGIKEHEDDVKPITILPETNDYPSVTVLPSKTTYSTLPQTFQSENIQTEITPEDHSQNGLPLNETHDDETTQKIEPPITEHSEPLVTEIASAEQTYPPSTKKYVNLTDSQSTPQYVETSSVTPTPIQHSTWTRKPIEEETSEPNYYPPVPMYPTGGGATGTDSGSEESEYDEGSAFGTGTCRYGGKIYVSAQQIPREDPCDFCFCFRSDIICLQQSCPPPIQGCRQETISGFCCPRYECPVASALAYNASTTTSTTTTSTTTTTQPHFTLESYRSHARKVGCMIHGYFYKVGDDIAIASGPCLECICGSDGRMKCDPKSCSPEPFVRSFIGEAMSKR